jgi:hypothetical protein
MGKACNMNGGEEEYIQDFDGNVRRIHAARKIYLG